MATENVAVGADRTLFTVQGRRMGNGYVVIVEGVVVGQLPVAGQGKPPASKQHAGLSPEVASFANY
jgi:hypothetical protein